MAADAVELQTAYRWHCESCGFENFTLPVRPECDPGGKESAYRQYFNLAIWQELPAVWRQFEFVCIPDTVKCRNCRSEFLTVDSNDLIEGA